MRPKCLAFDLNSFLTFSEAPGRSVDTATSADLRERKQIVLRTFFSSKFSDCVAEGVCLRESLCLAQVQLPEHPTPQLLDNDQLVAWKLLQLDLVVQQQRVEVAVRVELVIEWRRRRDAAVAAVQRGRRVRSIAVRVAVIAAVFHAAIVVTQCIRVVHDVSVMVHCSGLAAADLRGRVIFFGTGRGRNLGWLRENVVQGGRQANADVTTWHFWQ